MIRNIEVVHTKFILMSGFRIYYSKELDKILYSNHIMIYPPLMIGDDADKFNNYFI